MSKPVDSGGPRVMWTIGQIAERDGISKQAVSKVVKALVEGHDVPVERDSRGRLARISLAHYEHHRSQFANPAKVAAPRPAAPEEPTPRSDSFEEARRQGEWLKIERERIRHQEELKQLVRADRLGEALDICGREIQAVVARLPNKADDVAVAVSKEGVHGVRILLRDIAFELNSAIADLLEGIAAKAPKTDPVIGEDADA